MKLLFATSNDDKFVEVSSLLAPRGIKLELAKVEVEEIQGTRMERIVERKAADSFAILKRPLVADDTGIFFNAFPGFPGVNSKFCAKTLGVQKTVETLRSMDNSAYFATAACFYDGKQSRCFEARAEGSIVLQPRGVSPAKLPYDSYFVPKGEDRTFAQLGQEGKEKYSHRAAAFSKLADWLASSYSKK